MTLEETARQMIREAYGDDVKILDIEIKQGTKPGENYGSTMSSLTVTIQTANHNKTTLHLMAKCLPTSEFILDAFNVQVTFPKEIEFYQVVLPEYSKLLKENNTGIEYEKSFPKIFGAKSATNGDITLIMENIKIDGYRLVEKSQGLDFQHSALVIKEIALFHALGIAAKLKKPEIYETRIKKTGRSLKQGQDVAAVKTQINAFLDQVLDYLRKVDEVQDLVPRLEKVMKENFVYADMMEGYTPREPFSTFVHNDLWINNIMFKYHNNTPKSVKILDFQRCKIGSPISDLLLFLYVSTSLDVMRRQFDELLKLYHDNFVESLRRLGVPEENFRWDKFEEELKYASQEVSMPVSMIRFLFIKVECDISEFDLALMGSFDSGEACRTRHVEVVRDLARRGWI